MGKIIGMGNALVDVLAHIDNDETLAAMNLPKGSMQLIDIAQYAGISKRISGFSPAKASGGSAANTMLALARLGNKPALVGKIGKDADGQFYEAVCRDAGIDVRFSKSDKSTGVASTFISPDGQRTFATYLGAAAELAPGDLGDETFDGCDILYMEGYLVQNHALVDRAVKLAEARRMKICLDMASYNVVESDLDYFTHLVKNHVNVVFANEEESRALTSLAPYEAADKISTMCDIVVVKLGADGSIARKRDAKSGKVESARCKAGVPAHVVDTTAAGDFFAAGFLHALTRGCALESCLATGTILSTEVIQVDGTALPAHAWSEIQQQADDICK